MMTVLVEVRKSEIHGLGIFALQAIRKGQLLWGFTPGLDRSVSEYAVEFSEPRKRAFIMERGYLNAKNSHWVICVDEAQFWNFPANGLPANCILGDVLDGENLIIAASDIAAGEELTIAPESDADCKRKMEAR